MIQTSATLTSMVEVVTGIFLARLKAPEIAAAASPGQFIMVKCGGETVLPRPFSIHKADADSLAILFASVGKGTEWLSARQHGEKLDIFGPLGNSFTIAPEAQNLLLVAGGLGVAPLTFLTETALAQGKKVTLLVGARSIGNLVPLSVAQWCHAKGLAPGSMEAVYATEDGSEGYAGQVTELVVPYLVNTDAIYACGPLPMYRAMAADRSRYGLPVQVSLEIVMGCGTGVCHGCTIKTKSGLKQVCEDGPVFDMDDIDWDSVPAVP
jgi:dihydroorotate dehydrogenase electron transfer subunit